MKVLIEELGWSFPQSLKNLCTSVAQEDNYQFLANIRQTHDRLFMYISLNDLHESMIISTPSQLVHTSTLYVT